MIRRAPLRRTGSLGRRTPLKRVAIRQISAKRAAASSSRRSAVAEAFQRDGWVLVAGEWVGGRCIPRERGAPGGCFGKLTPHRLRKGSNLGGYTTDNVVSSCAFHNDWIEDQPKAARELGLVIR